MSYLEYLERTGFEDTSLSLAMWLRCTLNSLTGLPKTATAVALTGSTTKKMSEKVMHQTSSLAAISLSLAQAIAPHTGATPRAPDIVADYSSGPYHASFFFAYSGRAESSGSTPGSWIIGSLN